MKQNIYQFNQNMLPDTMFVTGTIAHLVEGNYCRLLDRRRTPGIIEKYFHNEAMFRWRIMDFEDKGKYWDIPAEDIIRYQFTHKAKKLKSQAIQQIENIIKKHQSSLIINIDPNKHTQTESKIKSIQQNIQKWLTKNSKFLKTTKQLNFKLRTGSKSLREDLRCYFTLINMWHIEEQTTSNIVMNPHSGEWVKGMNIVLAELGLAPYNDKKPRTSNVFKGLGKKEIRAAYLIQRLAFLRAYFSILGIKEVTLFRGISTENSFKKEPTLQTLTSYTFNLNVARSHCDFNSNSIIKESCLLKKTIPIESLFMTYLETEAMNQQYKEAEALVLNNI